MVIPVLELVAVAKDATTITLKDSTGVYNADTNPGGYGTPNAAAPTQIGIRAKYWPDSDIYGSIITADTDIVTSLLGGGYIFDLADFGVTGDAFAPGIHHFKYYPLELRDTVVTLTKDSKLVTVTAGTLPNAWDENYKGIVFSPDGGTTLGDKIFLIDYSKPLTSSTFYLTEAWTDDTVTGYSTLMAPEGDLKVLVSQLANQCLVSRIGKLAQSCTCDPSETDKLMYFVMQMFSAQVDFNCKDFQNAHNKIVGVYVQCNHCKLKCSCS